MAIVTPAWDDGPGRPDRPTKKDPNSVKIGNATVTPLVLEDVGVPIPKERIPETLVSPPQGSDAEDLATPLSCELQSELPALQKQAAMPVGRPQNTIWNAAGYPPALMDKLLIDTYALEWLDWEPETLRKEIAEDFSTTLSDPVFDKVMAIKLCHASQAPWQEWDIFQNVCLAFTDVPVDFGYMQFVSPAQAAYAIQQLDMLRKEDYSDDVKAYIATLCHEEGLVWLPPPLDMCQEPLDRLNVVDEAFKREILDIWDTVKDDDLKKWKFKEDKLGIQLARLASIRLYIDNVSTSTLPVQGNRD